MLWVAVVFVSILIHELGHATLQRRFGGHPRIMLYSLGGLAICDDCDRSPREPDSDFARRAGGRVSLFAALLSGRDPAVSGVSFEFWRFPGLRRLDLFLRWEPFASPVVNDAIFDLLYVNIFWGLVNLLPIYPLDGGQRRPRTLHAEQSAARNRQSLWLSIVAAAAMAVYGLIAAIRSSSAFMFGYLAYASYQTLQAYRAALAVIRRARSWIESRLGG